MKVIYLSRSSCGNSLFGRRCNDIVATEPPPGGEIIINQLYLCFVVTYLCFPAHKYLLLDMYLIVIFQRVVKIGVFVDEFNIKPCFQKVPQSQFLFCFFGRY